MKMSVMFLGAVIAATTVCAGWNPETKTYDHTGYISMREGVSESESTASFEAGTNWEDGNPPENGKCYYVPANSSLRMLNTCKTPFKGDILATAGGSTWQGSTASIPVYHLLSGASFDMYNNTETFTNGTWTLYRTEADKPVQLRMPQSNHGADRRGVIFKDIVLQGETDTELEFSTWENADDQWAELHPEKGNDFSGFFGTISILSRRPATQQTTFRPSQDENLTFSGTLKLGENCFLNATNVTANKSVDCSVGNLTMATGADLRIGITETAVRSLTVTGTFAHADAKVPLVVSAKPLGNVNFINGRDGSITTLTTISPIDGAVFRMKVADEADDTPRFGLDDFVLDYLGKGTLGLPTVLTSVVREDGYDQLKVKAKGIVRKNTNNENAYGTSLTNGLAWSDGTDPRPGWDYFANTSVTVPAGEWTFAGDSLTFGAKSNINGDLYYPDQGRTALHVGRLGLEGGTKVWARSTDAWLFVPQIVTYSSAFGPAVFQEYGAGRLTVVGEISGAADLFLRYHANKSFGRLDKGYLTFWGANTNLVGKVMLGCESYDNQSANTYVANEKERIEVTVGDGRALGGDMSAFAYDGLRIRDWALLNVTNTTEFAAANRGVFVDWMGCIGVKEGCVAAFRNPFTFGGRLQKQGAGTLAFGGSAAKFALGSTDSYTIVDDPVATTNELYVKEGCIMAMAADALNGVAITFAKGTGIKVDYAATGDVQTCGLRDTKWATPVAFDPDVDAIAVTLENLPEELTEEKTLGVLTVPADQADAIRSKLVFSRNGRKGFAGKIGKTVDGTSATLTLNVAPTGMLLLFR